MASDVPIFNSWFPNKLDPGQITKILVGLAVLYFVAKNTALGLILVFEILDIAKNAIRPNFPYIPIDLVFVFGITASYFYSPLVGIIIFGLGVFNRIFFLCLEPRHVSKSVRHILFYILISFFTYYSFFTAAFSFLVLNYAFKYGLRIADGSIANFDKAVFHVSNFIGSTAIFYLIHVVHSYFPFILS